MEDPRIFVAVGMEIEECRKTVKWAAANAAVHGEKSIVLLHVFKPTRWNEHLAEQEKQKAEIEEVLNKYEEICARKMVETDKLAIEDDDIGRGIIQQVYKRRISNLVMGAAADKDYSGEMRMPTSEKANIVLEQAHPACRILFICNGKLVYIRETGSRQRLPSSVECNGIPQWPPEFSMMPYMPILPPPPFISTFHEQVIHKCPEKWTLTVRGSWSGAPVPFETSNAPPQGLMARTRLLHEQLDGAMEEVEIARQQISDELVKRQNAEEDAEQAAHKLEEAMAEVEIAQRQISDELAKRQNAEKVAEQAARKLEEAMAEAEIAQQELSDELVKRQKAEKDADQAARKAKAAEVSYAKEVRLRKDIEVQLESLRIEKVQAIRELQQKFSAAKGLLVTVQRERDELLREREDAVREEEEMHRQRNKKEAASSSRGPLNFTEYQFSELKVATNDHGIKIGKGAYGSVYKGQLGETEVAVKILDPQSTQGGFEFQQEVKVLSTVRHQNLVALIGACSEHWALVYEYLPNGCLKDRLYCKDNTPPLSWQIRTRIAFEICSALIFLHSRKPESIVHGDLKPENILLDSNFVSKLGDFGLCRLIPSKDPKASAYLKTEPKGTIGYLDPQFFENGKLTPGSDVYSYGVVLLQLLTGKSPKGLKDLVEKEMNKDSLQRILDQKAGNWPFVQAERLARLALKCCEVDRRNRPNLEKDVQKPLEEMMTLVGSSASSSQLSTSMDAARIPSHFVCPISLEIMRDPHVAADGFTYEAEEIRKWLNNCNTSPMTNIPLSHTELTPNRTLKSAIQEWLRAQQS